MGVQSLQEHLRVPIVHSVTVMRFYFLSARDMGGLKIVGRRRTTLTWVNVPVLSEQMTETAPSVSTVVKDLHRTLLFRIRFAVIVKPAVSAIGKPSGMNAIATLTMSTIRVGTLM
jgi:hypothetical protein